MIFLSFLFFFLFFLGGGGVPIIFDSKIVVQYQHVMLEFALFHNGLHVVI